MRWTEPTIFSFHTEYSSGPKENWKNRELFPHKFDLGLWVRKISHRKGSKYLCLFLEKESQNENCQSLEHFLHLQKKNLFQYLIWNKLFYCAIKRFLKGSNLSMSAAKMMMKWDGSLKNIPKTIVICVYLISLFLWHLRIVQKRGAALRAFIRDVIIITIKLLVILVLVVF